MKPTTQIRFERLKSQAELPGNPNGFVVALCKRPIASQLSLHLIRSRAVLRASRQFRLRAGDFVLFDGRPCPVIRVTESAAVISVAQRRREFTTLFGKSVSLRPKPRLVRISANSEIPILNRKTN